MEKQKPLIIVILLLALALLLVTVLEENFLTFVTRAIGFPLLTIAYYKGVSSKKSYFFYFLLIFSLNELFGVFVYWAYTSSLVNDIMFYGRNSLYILSYVFLLLEIVSSFSIKKAIKQFSIPFIILFVIGVYLAYLGSDITVSSESFALANIFDSSIIILYNATLSLLLIAAVLSYLNKDSKKNMNMLIGVLCIVFSETIQLASFYISSELVLAVMHTVLIIFAFYFLIIQSQLRSDDASVKLEALDI